MKSEQLLETARAWQYREDLCEILNREQINVARTMLRQ